MKIPGIRWVLAALLIGFVEVAGCGRRGRPADPDSPTPSVFAPTPSVFAGSPSSGDSGLGDEEARREGRRAEAGRARAALAARLVAIRDGRVSDGGDTASGCSRFETLGPRATFEQQRRDGSPLACHPADKVRCLETATGFFVPVVATNSVECLWNLWFVPKRDAPNVPREPAWFDGFVESDHHTVGMLADDLNADGIVEAVILRDADPPVTGKTVILVTPTGTEVQTPFTDLRDVDRDGLLDGIVELRDYLGYDEARDAAAYLRGPTLVAHRLPDGRFSLGDDVARRERAHACRPPRRPVVAPSRRGIADNDETARRAICELADGTPTDTVKRQLTDACSAERRLSPEQCSISEGDLGAFVARFEALAIFCHQRPH